jgi:hypothetical protein
MESFFIRLMPNSALRSYILKMTSVVCFMFFSTFFLDNENSFRILTVHFNRYINILSTPCPKFVIIDFLTNRSLNGQLVNLTEISFLTHSDGLDERQDDRAAQGMTAIFGA